MPMPAIASILRDSPKPIAGDKSSIARVRCVLMRGGRYLLAQHNSRRRERIGRWGLPGGRLRPAEKPKACLRRELIEEFGADELLAIGWFTYEETAELAAAGKLRTGFELAAIAEFRRHHSSR